jgi:hypothetical protein
MGNPHDALMPSYEDTEAARQTNYEDQVVRFILKKSKLSVQEEFKVGSGVLGFWNFANFTGFPLWLECLKMRNLHKEFWGTDHLSDALYHRATRLPLYKAWLEAGSVRPPEYPEGPHGLVFAWPGRSKFTVLHNRVVVPGHGRGEFVCLRQDRLWIQDLEDLLLDFGGPENW